jgi:hypothetical protein
MHLAQPTGATNGTERENTLSPSRKFFLRPATRREMDERIELARRGRLVVVADLPERPEAEQAKAAAKAKPDKKAAAKERGDLF